VYVGCVSELRVLTWNLMHGRSVPGSGRDLLPEFAASLSRWHWDVALLQEVPPWWPSLLADRLGASQRLVLTSRNSLLPMRRAIARRWPDAIKSNGGGANAILIRGGVVVTEHRTQRLCRLPERRWVHAVRLGSGVWVGNLHATVHDDAAARRDAALAAATLLRWAGDAPAVLGGDFNVRSLALEGYTLGGGHDVDHVFVHHLEVVGGPVLPDRGRLSDHASVVVAALDAS
jgi:endonuclease/exonuclease/phosphatase family metal-dependent hydrolase